MEILPIAVGFLGVFALTYALFSIVGLSSSSLRFSKDEAIRLSDLFHGRSGWFIVVANIFGTLTSFATVYVFFVGTSKVFGWFVLFAPFTLLIGAFVTNWLTTRTLSNNRSLEAELKNSETTSSIIARVVWRPDENSKRASLLVKWVSIVNISAVLWLEFAIFSDVASLFVNNAWAPFGINLSGLWIATIVTTLVAYLIFRYGLRGFVFADLLQTPIIAVAAIVTLAAVMYIVFFQLPAEGKEVDLFNIKPFVPVEHAWLFALHVLSLNLAFVFLTEGHWFRLWLFKDREIKDQIISIFGTTVVWIILAFCGILAVFITKNIGPGGINDVLTQITNINAAFPFIFWLGASAALFSTADAQIYYLFLVRSYDAKSGELGDNINRPRNPLLIAFGIALAFAAAYGVVRHFQIPMEKLVFILFPISLNALPAMIAAAFGRPIRYEWTLGSIALYAICSGLGVWQLADQFFWTLMAGIMPLGVTILMLIVQFLSGFAPQSDKGS